MPTTDSPAPTARRSLSGLGRRVDTYMFAVAGAAIMASALVARIESSAGNGDVNWWLFGVIVALLFFSEAKATTWLRFGSGGTVTPSWTFAFSLMLLGSPTGAIVSIGLASLLADVLARKPAIKVVFNVTQICFSSALGALVLLAFGIHGPMFDDFALAPDRALAMLLSGVAVFVSNGVIICRLLAFVERVPFMTMLRQTLALSMSADAAMLALAPILLITARQSLLMLPLIGTATFFVFQTARQAIARAHEANHDVLTQLLNRRSFVFELDKLLLQHECSGSVFVLDLDKFKEVNDRLGHQTGDHVLQEFGARLVNHLPEDARVARLGGDEFAVLIPDADPDDAFAIAGRLYEELQAPLVVDGFPISAGTSIGIAHFPIHGENSEDLMHAADVAMYRSKRFRSGVEVYVTFGTTQQLGRVTLLGDVGPALDHGEFVVEYQPQVTLSNNRVSSVEALLRWDHPVHGRVAPGEFITLAEHTDLIGAITDFVIRQALTDISSVSSQMLIAVNVSARNLQDRFFAQRTLDLLDELGVLANRLEIEITESAVAIDPEVAAVTIEQLRSAGVRVVIDDFGTGYSSFATLRNLAIDGIKIDRSFVTSVVGDNGGIQIVSSLISLAHGLGLSVVAEGVETHDARVLLEALGCDVIQGFLVARSMPLACLSEFLEQREASIDHQAALAPDSHVTPEVEFSS